MNKIFFLLIAFQVKHFVADYPLQGVYMLGKFKDKGWVKPLLSHVAVHGFFTALICAFVNFKMIIPMILSDMTIHFIMDRIKASSKMLGRYRALSKDEAKVFIGQFNTLLQVAQDKRIDEKKQVQVLSGLKRVTARFRENTYFWWSLGLDQGVHHLTHYLIIFLIVN